MSASLPCKGSESAKSVLSVLLAGERPDETAEPVSEMAGGLVLFVVVVDDDDGVGCRMTGTEGIALSPGPTLCGLSSVTELLDELELEVESSDDDEKDDVVDQDEDDLDRPDKRVGDVLVLALYPSLGSLMSPSPNDSDSLSKEVESPSDSR